MVNALSENITLATAFLTEFVATDEVMTKLYLAGNRPSAFASVLATTDDADLVAFGEAGAEAVLMPAIPEMGSVWGGWGDAFTLIINGTQSAADALNNAGEQIRGLIGGAAAGMVNVPGSWQAAAGCPGDWQPDCAATALRSNGDGTYSRTFDIPAGEYEAKVALDGAWTENYGVDGKADGDNYPFALTSDGSVTFTFDSNTKLLTIDIEAGEMGGAAAFTCEVDLTGEEFVIYQQAGREGPLAAILGQGFALATEDSVKYVNDNGGVCGATLRVVYCESNYAVEQEIACYERARTSTPKPVILLSYGSGATIALKDRVNEDKVVHIVAGLEADAIYNPANGYTVAAAPIYSDQFAGFMTFLKDNWADIKPAGAGDDIVVGVIGWANAFGAGATTAEALAYAEEIGVTVLPLEQQEISPSADVTGQLQNLLLQGANVIYAQNLSFGSTQVIGTVRALGVWDSVIVGGTNWSMNNDVLSYLGASTAAANGYYGVFPYYWYSDEEIPGVQLANEAFEASGYPETERAVTYLLTWGTFLAIRDVLTVAANEAGSAAAVTGEGVLAAMQEMGIVEGGGILALDVRDENRSPRSSQIRQWQWDGSKMNYVVVQDFFELPDTRP
jgi:ABC-type branched-subunit amino acid transport system substrate-binding protein